MKYMFCCCHLSNVCNVLNWPQLYQHWTVVIVEHITMANIGKTAREYNALLISLGSFHSDSFGPGDSTVAQVMAWCHQGEAMLTSH